MQNSGLASKQELQAKNSQLSQVRSHVSVLWPQTWWLETTDLLFFSSVESWNESQFHRVNIQVSARLVCSGFLWLLEFDCVAWFMNPQSLFLLSHYTWFSSAVKLPCSFLLLVMPFKTHLNNPARSPQPRSLSSITSAVSFFLSG